MRVEQLEGPPIVRQRRLELPLLVQRRAEHHVRPDEMGRIAEPFGDMQRLPGKMLRLFHLEQVHMVELQAAERREFPGIVIELPTEFPGPRIGSADVGVAEAPRRVQGGTERHLQVQLARGPLAHIRQRVDQRQASAELVDCFDVRRLARRGHAGFVPVGDCLRRAVRLRVVMRHQFRLRARHLGKAILQQLCHLLVILLAGAFQQRLVSRILDKRMFEEVARAGRAAALLFEGPKGLEQMFGQSIPVDWDDPSLEFVRKTVLKKYCSLIHGQPVLEATLDLKRSYGLVAVDVEHVRCDIFRAGYDLAGGGNYGSKDHPWTKEQGDYNLKYLISAALLDGQVGPTQLDAVRIQAPDAQAMVARVEVRPDEQLTARFPKELAARITVRTKDQRVLVKEHLGYEGGLDQPMSWDRVVEKFHWLSEAFAEEDLRNRLIQAVQQLDLRPTSDLMDLLAQVRPTAVFPSTHPGIQ